MPEFFSYDPLTGVTRYFDHDEQSNDSFIRTEQDVAPLLDRNMEWRNAGKKDGKQDLKLYATIPPVVILELKKRGIDIYSKDKSMQKRMFQEINRSYPYLKTTFKMHE